MATKVYFFYSEEIAQNGRTFGITCIVSDDNETFLKISEINLFLEKFQNSKNFQKHKFALIPKNVRDGRSRRNLETPTLLHDGNTDFTNLQKIKVTMRMSCFRETG